MSPPAAAARAAWFGYWNTMRRYHRYEVRGLEHLPRDGSALVAGYHGRPIAHDLCMLQALLAERAVRLRPIIHSYFRTAPLLSWIYQGVDFLDGDGDSMAQAIARGDLIVVTPGGTREGCRSFRDRYRVDWGERFGYLRLARKYGLRIIPAAARGIDDTYLALNDGYRWGRRAGLPGGLPLWLGLGPLGPWPLSPPFPVKIVQRLGPPIDVSSTDDLSSLHSRVIAAVQDLLNASETAHDATTRE
jgi:1-acyl-sn-glycerol-3-phosphate acyltransferase